MAIETIEAEAEAKKAFMGTQSICEIWKCPNMTDIVEVSAEIEGEVSVLSEAMTPEACTVTVARFAALPAGPEVAVVTTS